MGADIKQLRSRIKSVGSTLQLTKAMGLVASSKIRKANEAMIKSSEFSKAYEEAIEILSSSSECLKSPYMQENEGKTRIIIIAGDRGLAGGYNANVFRLAANYEDAEMIPIGKRACDRFGDEKNSAEGFSPEEAQKLAEELCRDFSEGKFKRLGIIKTEYVSIMTQNAVIEWILPLAKKENKNNAGMIFEPDELSVLNYAVTGYVAGKIVAAVRESFASEVAARRMAMDSAGKNAQQMIDDLTLEYNRVRQGAITQEITEIVAGSGD